MLLNGLEK